MNITDKLILKGCKQKFINCFTPEFQTKMVQEDNPECFALDFVLKLGLKSCSNKIYRKSIKHIIQPNILDMAIAWAKISSEYGYAPIISNEVKEILHDATLELADEIYV